MQQDHKVRHKVDPAAERVHIGPVATGAKQSKLQGQVHASGQAHQARHDDLHTNLPSDHAQHSGK